MVWSGVVGDREKGEQERVAGGAQGVGVVHGVARC